MSNGFIHDYLGLSPRRKPPATRCELLRPLTHTYLPETESCTASPIWMLARDNRAEAFLFPIYEDNSATPKINRILLLELGDRFPYQKWQPVKINLMDRDHQRIRTLVIKRGGIVVEEIKHPGRGVVERSFDACGDYTAHCVTNPGSLSQACGFAVCELDFGPPITSRATSDWNSKVAARLYRSSKDVRVSVDQSLITTGDVK